MKKLFISGLIALLTLPMQAQQNAKIYVDMGTRGHDVSKSMYGIFFEEINHAGDGGLYAEMLQNRGFEEHVYPSGMTYNASLARVEKTAQNYYGLDQVTTWVGWNINDRKWTGWQVTSTDCQVVKDIVTLDAPLHENTPNALHLTISGATASSLANVTNTGYWGVSTKQGATYRLRFYLRTTDYAGQVKAQFVNKSSVPFGEQSFDVTANGQWTEYTATLTADQAMSDGAFRLQFSGNGTIDIDYVSLFPTDTYKGRENGLRRDIAETLAEMRPSFMRWPGGCIVEGISLDNRVKWKETLGDPMTRRGEYSLWDYRSTYGLGMYEFLQMCEDMGMDGMFVGNVGISCSLRSGEFVSPTDEAALLPYRQDIEDAIEFAIGDPATNEWAARRAEMGHPEAFPLKYVELGNENGTDRYSKRYRFFHDYLKAKYPQLTFISTEVWWDNGEDKGHYDTDMLDVHWYVTPDEFYNDATLFEEVSAEQRARYTVYAGEYAANGNVGQGNMDASLAEACFIGCMERNSDLVKMASYAPLLTNENRQNWFCNLIHFDNDAVWGRASYYVQTLYAQNRPDYNVKTRMFSNEQNLLTRGRIGLGTWNTQAEFRGVKVVSHDGSQTYYESDFQNKPNEWSEQAGTWTMTDEGTYKQTANGTPCYTIMNAADFTDCVVEFEARRTGGAEGFLLYFGQDATGKNGYRLNLGGWGNTLSAFEKVVNGGATTASQQVSTHFNDNQWYKIRLVMKEGKHLTLYVDGVETLKKELYDIKNGRLQAFGGYDSEAGELVVKVVNALTHTTKGTVRLNANGIVASGKVITLKADQLTDENDKENPTRISPVESSYSGFAEEFDYDFPANSLTIFRIKCSEAAPAALDIPDYKWNSDPVTNDEAEQLLQQAKSRLQLLVDRANYLYVEGAEGAETLKSAITEAESQLELGIINRLNAAYSTLDNALTAYMQKLMAADKEKTALLENPNFSSGSNSGWQGNAPALEAGVGEFFNMTFDTYQTLTGLDNGTYLIYVQGFYRNGSQTDSYAAHNNGTEQLLAQLYGNDSAYPLCSLYDYQTGGWNNGYADNRTQANEGFTTSKDNYANYLFANVTDGTLKLGIKKATAVGWDWTCFNNFRVFYVPVNTTTSVGDVKTPQQGPPVYYTLDGVAHQLPVQGINIHNGKKMVVR